MPLLIPINFLLVIRASTSWGLSFRMMLTSATVKKRGFRRGSREAGGLDDLDIRSVFCFLICELPMQLQLTEGPLRCGYCEGC